MTNWKDEFGKEFDAYVMHGKFKAYNFMEAVVKSDSLFITYHGAEIITHWVCNLGFVKGFSQDTEMLEDLFLRLDSIMRENICGDFLRSFPDRSKEIYIDCLMHLEKINQEEMEG